MADLTQRRGRDTFVTDSTAGNPNKEHSQAEVLKLQSTHARVFVTLPLPGIKGRTIEQATLSCPAKGSWASQTLTATPIAERWTPRNVTFNDAPSVRTAQAVTAAQGALAEGERIEIDVTDHVQRVADGAKHYGWEVKTGSSSTNRLYSFQSPDSGSWVLRVDFIEAPEAPTDLAPNGNVVAVEPILTFDFVDLGGESTELASIRVQVNTTASSSGAWGSGHIDATEPEFDLAASAWPTTPTSGTTYYWRVWVKDGAGYESDPSDWASFTYAPKPTLTIDNPDSGLAWDPTPTITAHISAGSIKAYRVRIAKGNDKSHELYDSGKLPGSGSSLAHTIPFKDDRGRRILKDDSTYWLNVRVWDRNDREATPGDPTWVQQWTQFVLDDDATPPPPSALTATQIGETPKVRLTWFRDTGAPEGWVVRRDGEIIARLDPDEVDVDGDTYTWIDLGAAPWVQHEYAVKVIDGSKQSAKSPTATITVEAEGLWLLTSSSTIRIDGDETTGFEVTDKRATYSPIGTPADVDIVYAFPGVTGGFAGIISDDDEGVNVDDVRRSILDLKDKPHREVQLVYGTVSVPVQLRNVSVLPAQTFDAITRDHEVRFEVQQVGDFEVGV